MKKRTTVILLVLVIAAGGGGAAVAWLHPEWLPKWAHRRQSAPPDTAGLRCTEHGVPESYCTLCHPELRQTLELCDEHGGIPEAICTLCHPEVKDKYQLEVCAPHGLPKSFCAECTKSSAQKSQMVDDGWCSTHGMPEALCEECKAGGAKLDAKGNRICATGLPLVRLASPTIAQHIGLETARATTKTHAHWLEANAETAFDANRNAEVNPRVGGFLREAKVDLGQVVEAGELLAVVDSAEVSAAKSRYLSALARLKLAQTAYDRTRKLVQGDALPGKLELEAQTELNQAESGALDAAQLLRNYGLSEADLHHIVESKDISSQFRVVAPISGTIIERHAVRNEAIQATMKLFSIADVRTMWLWIDVYESDVDQVRRGMPVKFRISGANASEFVGKITWTGEEVDPTTRTTRMRAEIDNSHGRLRANQFGLALIEVGEPHDVLVIPKAAVQQYEGADVVFIPDGEGVYRPQRIISKPSTLKDEVEVEWGLKPGDEVITKGSFWLKTEIMRSGIGAGCCG